MLSNEMTSTISGLLFREGCTECYLFGSHVTAVQMKIPILT